MRSLSLFAIACLTACGGKTPEVKSPEAAASQPAAQMPKTEAAGAMPASMPARVPSILSGAEITESGADKPTSNSGCHWLSADGKQVACVEHMIEMGFGHSKVRIFDVSNPGKALSEHLVFNGDTGDAKNIKPDAVAAVNAAFAKGGFVAEGKYGGDGKIDPKGAAARAPKPSGEHSTCCVMSPSSTVAFERTGLVTTTFDIACHYGAEKSAGACYIKDYNDESHPHEVAFVFTP
ncbi:MAG: hypothetical protein ACE366_13645 [Bradymonadia bacterium]